MYVYFTLQGKVCDCDVSAVDCSVGLGTRCVRQSDFCGFWYSESHSKWLNPSYRASVKCNV